MKWIKVCVCVCFHMFHVVYLLMMPLTLYLWIFFLMIHP